MLDLSIDILEKTTKNKKSFKQNCMMMGKRKK